MTQFDSEAIRHRFYSELAECSKALVWRTSIPQGIMGWNPILTASLVELGMAGRPTALEKRRTARYWQIVPALYLQFGSYRQR